MTTGVAEAEPSLVSARHSSPAKRRNWIRIPIYASALGLLVLTALKDTRPADAQSDFEHARQLFLHGYLSKSQEAAEIGYGRFRSSNPEWATRFQLLEAEAMVWRGMYDEAQRVLAIPLAAPDLPTEAIQRLSIRAVALVRLQHFDAATQDLTEAEGLCSRGENPACGGVLRARGMLAMEQGRFTDARQFFLDSLQVARRHSDKWLEATALLNLGAAFLQEEQYDEALDWSRSAHEAAVGLRGEDLEEAALGNLGWAYLGLGDTDRALDLFREAEQRATELGDFRDQLKWLSTAGNAYLDSSNLDLSARSYRSALDLARKINSKQDIINSLEDLAHVSIQVGQLDAASTYVAELSPLVLATASRLDDLDVMLAKGKIAAARKQDQQAKDIFVAVEKDSASQTSMRLGAEHELARLFEQENDAKDADDSYRTALTTFESARSELKEEDSKLPFLTNATPIYDDYIHFLVKQGKVDEALALADQSRARTLAQGLGVETGKQTLVSAPPRFGQIAQKTGATLLFYWLGEEQSYLWAVTPKSTALFTLPAQSQIAPLLERYRRAILGPVDPLESANEDGRALYNMLVAPASSMIRANAPVVILTDGVLSQLNFETLIAPGPATVSTSGSSAHKDAKTAEPAVHYWIEDVTLVSAPSLSMLATAKPSHIGERKLLLLGDAVSPGQDYPELPMASLEMRQIERHFSTHNAAVFTRERANPAAYLASKPGEYSYIHFVTHGVASRTDPLDSAIILSRSGEAEDSFKLHAREIIHRPIDARLVTISACYGGGARSYAGEGLVGLSWAFLRAGAHDVIGALWEASDDSTPMLMDDLYQGIEEGMEPGTALHRAKLTLLHSNGKFRRPFYWGAFQIYAGH